ncbi:MAG: biopolymer transporter ExbD [bacterium]
MKGAHSHRPRAISFRATAMIDMAFLLITFFIMSIRFGQAGEETIELPNADQAREVTDERVELVTVNVSGEGVYLVSGVQRSRAELYRYIEARKAEASEHRKLEIVVRGDRSSRFENVQAVMRMAADAGVTDVSLAALQATDDVEQR